MTRPDPDQPPLGAKHAQSAAPADAGPQHSAAARGGPAMRMASYNVRKAVGLDWRRDPERIVDVLAEIDADVVVLQEADKRLGARAGVLPLERLRAMGYALAEVALRPQSHGWHGNVILVRAPYAAQSPRRIDLPTLEPRGAVATTVAPLGLTVIGTHLGLTSGIRRRQFSELVSAIQGPAVIAGDFNHWGSEIDLPHGDVITPGPSFHAARPRAALDRFILFGVHAMSGQVHDTALARRASDHLPVVLEFTCHPS